jgi:4-amino-4-deoxychorismate lyase
MALDNPQPTTAPSLIETMHADARGRIPLLNAHLGRLRGSAKALDYFYPGDEFITTALTQRLATSAHAKSPKPHEHRVRLLLSADGAISITLAKLDPLPSKQYIALSRIRLPSGNSWLQHKTTFRPWYEHAMTWLAEHPSFFDLVYLNEKSELCEGSRSNIYLKRDGQWLTPPLPSGLLGGVQRLELLRQGKVKEATLSQTDLLTATQWRLSNALRGWFDVQLDLSVSD